MGEVILNLLLASYVLISDDDKQHELSWTRKAAKQAEDVASVFCSGHGRAFLDVAINHLEGATEGTNNNPRLPSCECNSCYYVSDCSQFSADCPANADSGDPLFLEPFWIKHAETSAVMVSGWHRMSYKFGYENGTFISKKLERHIQKLHAMVGNANGTGKFMVYKSQTEFYNSKNFEWEGDTAVWKNKSLPLSVNFIEFVTSPNNPDGKLKDPVLLQGPSVKTINDHAYYWPHYTAIPAHANEDLMIFTLSKLTGHGSSRFGMGVSRDAQLRALELLKVLLGDGKEFFEFGHRTTRSRWESLNKVISESKRFSLQKLILDIPRISKISPLLLQVRLELYYAWIKCEKEEDENCYEVLLRNGGIIGRSGSFFRAENRYVRLSLIKSQDDFDWLLERMKALVSQEQVHEQYNVKVA
ncbi:hypothetical protein C5167_003975 [Papaver somniferum]|nr:hypothetical protein C5167_003975 [Papaver somniferum]